MALGVGVPERVTRDLRLIERQRLSVAVELGGIQAEQRVDPFSKGLPEQRRGHRVIAVRVHTRAWKRPKIRNRCVGIALPCAYLMLANGVDDDIEYR